MKKTKWIWTALMSTSLMQATAQQEVSHIDIPTDGILVLMGVTTLILLVILLSLMRIVRRSIVAKRPEIGQALKKGTSVILLIFISQLAMAQDSAEPLAEAATQSTGWFGLPVWVWVVYFLTITLELAGIAAFIKIINEVNFPKDPSVVKRKSWFSKLSGAVTEEEAADLDMNHDYDGISELDNRIPQWWLYTFYFTILFGVVYMYRMFGNHAIPTQYEQLEQSIAEARIEQRKRDEAAGGAIDENSVKLVGESGIQNGQSLFYANCRACHGDQAQGAAVGPNLTDEYWLHGGSIQDVFHSIKAGWPDKGMQSWSAILSPSEMQDVASYIMSVQGTNPPGARGPQGEKYVPEAGAADTPAAEAADSTHATTTESESETPEEESQA